MSPSTDFRMFWGKAQPQIGAMHPWHPAAFHLLDVAAVGHVLLARRPDLRSRLSALLGLPQSEAQRLVVSLLALHDLGKFGVAFQCKAPACWPELALGPMREYPRSGHTADGLTLWEGHLVEVLARRWWPTTPAPAESFLEALGPAIFGHHGRPVEANGSSAVRVMSERGVAAARDCASSIVELLLPDPLEHAPPSDREARAASWWLAGLITLCDWIGSNQRWFPYSSPEVELAHYHSRALAAADVAVREAGLLGVRSSARRSFSELTALDSPTPAQRWADTVPMPGGPVLAIIEDVTGAGKTEAAHVLAHRLLADGRASGVYWAMPTQATANAMYTRQRHLIGRLFETQEGSRPSLALAHGQARLHEAFRASVIEGIKAISGVEDAPDLRSEVACAAFLADDRRASLLADVGAGTVDQALLGVLPSRFSALRLFGLAGKVLVLDEVHAYDAYVTREVQELLRFQAALGGSAVVLSATLGARLRDELVAAWRSGLGVRQHGPDSVGTIEAPYPLATLVSGHGVLSEALPAAERSRRRVPVRFVHEQAEALDHVLRAQRRGAAVAWICNTVDSCIQRARALEECGVAPIVFHARFAQGDRQAREREVMDTFGQRDAGGSTIPADRRRGRVLVATQVVEQSLDIDFDVLVTDLAPVDLLIQRAGRLWRHQRERPPGLEPEVVVLAPAQDEPPPRDWPEAVLPATRYVYEAVDVLWRSMSALRDAGAIATPGRPGRPDSVRALVERAYDDEEAAPEALEARVAAAQGKLGAAAAMAAMNVLDLNQGYALGGRALWPADVRTPTRLDASTVRVRLARLEGDGRLLPWCRDPSPSRAWALSEVALSHRRVPPRARPPARLAEAVQAVKVAWSPFEHDLPVLVLEPGPDGHWRGALADERSAERLFEYDTTMGLRAEKNDAAVSG